MLEIPIEEIASNLDLPPFVHHIPGQGSSSRAIFLLVNNEPYGLLLDVRL